MQSAVQPWSHKLRPLVHDRIVVIGSGIVSLALVTAAFALFSGAGGAPVYTHTHCPACEEEYPYNARSAGAKCGRCGYDGVLVATAGPFKEAEGADGALTKALLATLFVAIVVQGWAYVVFMRLKALHRAEDDARKQVLVCRCPFCGRKVGFPAYKFGSAGTCPRCKTAFVLAAS